MRERREHSHDLRIEKISVNCGVLDQSLFDGVPDADGVIRVPGKAPVMPFRKFESVYDSDAYPEDVRYEYVALEELTTRFRISFNYQLEKMPDNAQRDVILEIIHKHKDYLTSLEAALADVKDQTA